MRIRLCLLAFALCTAPAAAQLELKVGRDALSWIDVQDSLAFVISSPDSVWTWRVDPGENLMANVAGRGGSILVSAQQPSFNPFGEAILTPVFLDEVTAVKFIGDGDLSTAFNPDDFGLDRQTSIYIDLGGAYSIERTLAAARRRTRGLFSADFRFGFGRPSTSGGDADAVVDHQRRFLSALSIFRYHPTQYSCGGRMAGGAAGER